MEQTQTQEDLTRRTIIKEDGRFLNFYNVTGEDQPINPDAEKSQPALADPETALPSIAARKDNA